MRPGLEGTSNRNYGAWVTSRNWVRHALARPMFAAPGEEMEYSTGNTHLLSAILTQATGKSTWQFANEMLAKPLGFSLRAVAARSAGHLLRRQRHADDAAADAGVRRAVFERRRRQRPAACCRRAGSTQSCEGRTREPAAGQSGSGCRRRRRSDARSAVRLRLVGLRDWRRRHLLCVGLRRPVHLRLSRRSISSW